MIDRTLPDGLPDQFEMANSESPHGIAKAVQRAILSSMMQIISDLKRESKAPGLTWEQLEYFFEEYKKKEPVVITQEYEV